VLGSKRKEWSPETDITGGPCHANLVGVLVCVAGVS
jgi:hypothetical protein